MMKSNYIILLVCILFGLQSPIAAQSSDWVYSPYAQYLTNDTTIPPPVGEPADAALSCFRHDTIYVLVMPTGQLYIWLRPDPLLDKYIQSSPYAYCDGNPLKYIDPQGDSTRIWVETQGVGHTWITSGEGDNLQVYSYGRYGDLNKNKTHFRSLCMNGEGVLLRLTGEEAKQYIEEKMTNTNPIYKVISDVSDNQVQEYFDKMFNTHPQLISNPKSKYYQSPYAHIIDSYNLLTNNCTTTAISAINDIGSSFFYQTFYIPSPNGKGYEMTGYKMFVVPASLYQFLKNR